MIDFPPGLTAADVTRALTLRRLARNDYATYGRFEDEESRRLCDTVERPWLNNAPDVSCFPATQPGERFLCYLRWSDKHGRKVYGIYGPEGRKDLEIHIANLPSELLGCVAVGESFGIAQSKRTGETGPGVLGSELAFDAFMATLDGAPFWLTVVDPSADATVMPA